MWADRPFHALTGNIAISYTTFIIVFVNWTAEIGKSKSFMIGLLDVPIRESNDLQDELHCYGFLRGDKPSYLNDDMKCVATNTCCSATLRSSQSGKLLVPRRKTSRIGQRSVRVAVPSLWNSMPSHLTTQTLNELFYKNMKTYLFLKCYS